MNAVNFLSFIIAKIIVIAINIVVYPIYFISNILYTVSSNILKAVNNQVEGR